MGKVTITMKSPLVGVLVSAVDCNNKFESRITCIISGPEKVTVSFEGTTQCCAKPDQMNNQC